MSNTSSSKTFTRERDAKYAAKQAGLTLDQIVTAEINGRWGYSLKVVEPVKVVETAKVAGVKKEAPEGKRAEVVALCSRPEGATRSELIDLTGWAKAPWKWLLSNPQGTGVCDRYGYDLKVEQTGRNPRYFVTGLAAA